LRLFLGSVRKNWRFYSSKFDNCSVFRSVVFYKLSEYPGTNPLPRGNLVSCLKKWRFRNSYSNMQHKKSFELLMSQGSRKRFQDLRRFWGFAF
jgi:hypothetical protein